MTESKGVIAALSTAGFILSVFLVSASFFVERWKQFIVVALCWIFFTERRYRFLFMVLTTLPRDARAVVKYLLTLFQFYYWRTFSGRYGGITDIFLRNVQRHPKKIAFRFEDQSWTFQEVEDFTNRVANYFKSQGVVKGDTLGLIMENRPEVVFLWLGLAKLGAVTALINNNQRGDVLSHSITSGNCKRIICSTVLLDGLIEILPNWPDLVVYTTGHLEKNHPDCINLDDVLPLSPSTPLTHITKCAMNDTVLLIYTSGTTGMPKAAKMNHARFFMMARGLFNMMWMRRNDVIYNTLPLYHTAGGILGVGQALLNGLTVVIRLKFSASNFWTDCIKYNCTVAQYIGEMCRFLLAAPERPERLAHKVRLIFGNGLRPQIWTAFVDRFRIQDVGEFYGSTEGNCNMVNSENKVGAVGFLPWFAPLVNANYLIRADPETNEPIRGNDGLCINCKEGEAGILIGIVKKVHPFSQFTGYADKKATEKKILRNVFKQGDEYFNTGDILVKDEFGYFYFRDRTGDTFRWKGENVATSEVEAVISNIIKLKDAIVYGVEVPEMEGRAGMAAIVDTDHTLNLEDLAEGVRKSLPAYARPLFLRILNSVPLTGTFKLRKVDLQNEGYNPASVQDPLYFFKGNSYVPLSAEVYDDIVSGKVKL